MTTIIEVSPCYYVLGQAFQPDGAAVRLESLTCGLKTKKALRSLRVSGLRVVRFRTYRLQTTSGPATPRAKIKPEPIGGANETHAQTIAQITGRLPSTTYFRQ
jgi:hypothetical protein